MRDKHCVVLPFIDGKKLLAGLSPPKGRCFIMDRQPSYDHPLTRDIAPSTIITTMQSINKTRIDVPSKLDFAKQV